LITSDQYPPLTYYQGESTITNLWIITPDGSASKYPLHFDGTGIYFIPESMLVLPAGASFSFTQELILVDQNALRV